MAQRSSVGSRAWVSFAVAKVASLLLRRRRRRFSLLSVFPSVVCCENPSTSMQRFVWLLWCVDEVCRYGLLFLSLFCFLTPPSFSAGFRRANWTKSFACFSSLFFGWKRKKSNALYMHVVMSPIHSCFFNFFVFLFFCYCYFDRIIEELRFLCMCVCVFGWYRGEGDRYWELVKY